ncbi:MAG: hypothetical protein JW734_03775 [Candidatus Omnitrophica bacterium]|nr:hypothetical protein [Candidatus Omnitrophota bacterium]
METFASRLSGLLKRNITVVTTQMEEGKAVVYGGTLMEVGSDYLVIKVPREGQQVINFAHIVRAFENI